MATNDWTPDQPLRAGATARDIQHRARKLSLFTSMAVAVVNVARELAAAECAERDARIAALEEELAANRNEMVRLNEVAQAAFAWYDGKGGMPLVDAIAEYRIYLCDSERLEQIIRERGPNVPLYAHPAVAPTPNDAVLRLAIDRAEAAERALAQATAQVTTTYAASTTVAPTSDAAVSPSSVPCGRCGSLPCVNADSDAGPVGYLSCDRCDSGTPIHPSAWLTAHRVTVAPTSEDTKRWLVFNVGCIECGVSSAPVACYATEKEASAIATLLNDKLSWREGGQNSFEVFDLSAPMASEYRAAMRSTPTETNND